MSSPTSPDRSRRRVRMADAALARVTAQRDWFAAAYASARTAQARFNIAADALRAAASERSCHDEPAVSERLDEITTQVTTLLDELHQQQEQRANRVLRTDERRQIRNEERRRREPCDG